MGRSQWKIDYGSGPQSLARSARLSAQEFRLSDMYRRAVFLHGCSCGKRGRMAALTYKTLIYSGTERHYGHPSSAPQFRRSVPLFYVKTRILMNEIYYAKPRQLDIRRIASLIGEKPYVVAAVIQRVLEKQARQQKRVGVQYYVANWWAQISASELRDIHHRAYDAARALVEEEVLRCDESYVREGSHIQGAKSKSFKFGRGLSERSLEFFRVELSSIHHHARRSLSKKKTENIFEAPDELREVAQHVFNFNFGLSNHPPSKFSELGDIQKPQFAHLLNGQRHFKEAGFAGRVYTSFTAIPKAYRGHVSFTGSPELIEIDLSMSQPFLLACVLNDGCGGGVVDGSSVLKGREHYTDVVTGETGMDIYEHAAEVLQDRYDTEVTRSDVKPKVLMLLNAPTADIHSNTYITPSGREAENKLKHLDRGFRKKFSGVMEAADQLREKVKNRYDTSLGDWLNQFEAEIMVRHVAKELADAPVLTLHDCVAVPPEREEKARTLIEEKFYERFGIAPHLTTEHLGTETETTESGPEKDRDVEKREPNGVA